MMSAETWIAFIIAAGIVLVIPGPTILAVISHSLSCGRRAVIPLVAGVAIGDLTAMTCSLLGMGAVLAASSALFSALKLVGAVYLIYIGVKLFRSGASEAEDISAPETVTGKTMLSRLFVITALNPKSIAFFVAFLPQFVNPKYPHIPQFLLLGGTFLSLAILNATFYSLFAGSLREKIESGSVRKRLNYCGGIVLIGAGVFTAAMRR